MSCAVSVTSHANPWWRVWRIIRNVISSQGKCSVIKALQLRQEGHIARPRRMTFEELFLVMGRAGRRKSRALSDPSRVWRRELQKSLKEDYSFTSDKKKIDETTEGMDRYATYTELTLPPLTRTAILDKMCGTLLCRIPATFAPSPLSLKQCWTILRQAFPYEQHCMGEGGR